jgi:hypothetical protein
MFMGNLGLYGPWVSLSPCFSHKHKSVSHLKMVIIFVVTARTIGYFVCFWESCEDEIVRGIFLERSMASINAGHQRISYGDIINL